jgi:signal transduction histidine kinase
MRKRLLVAFLGLTLLTLVLYGVPRGLILAERTREAERQEVTRHAVLVQRAIETRLAAEAPIEASDLAAAFIGPDAVTYRDAGGSEVVAGPDLQDERVAVRVLRPVPGGGTLVVERPGPVVDQRVAEAVLPIVVVGLGVLAVAAGVAVLLSHRLSLPFRGLAAAAERLGEGAFEGEIPEQRLPEAAAIARALERSEERLVDVIRRERDFASNASHQLRTPLTALRLDLEDLSMIPEVRAVAGAELQEALTEVDRLTETVSGLLHLARLRSPGESVDLDLDELVEQAAARWRPAAESAGRPLDVDAHGPVPVEAPPAAVLQVLDVLIENALDHGEGKVTVVTDRQEDHGRVQVCDDGPGLDEVAAEALFTRRHRGASSSGEGIGLALAKEVTQALGGRLAVRPGPHTTFELLLPRHARSRMAGA